jgi:D-glycero-D-manno-heptose 1,7-bisphosphate phosphatase
VVGAGAVAAPGRAVFLDRDGVLVVPEFRDGRSYAPRQLENFAINPDARSCLDRLQAAGFALVVVTNQPDVGAGRISLDVLDAMHVRLREALPVDEIVVCPHTRADLCDCRKPNPGMLVAAAERHGIDLTRSFMVGDRASDTEAGEAAGCRTAFLDLAYEAEPRPEGADFYGTSLASITDWILEVDAGAGR